jgi:hypothetical protein
MKTIISAIQRSISTTNKAADRMAVLRKIGGAGGPSKWMIQTEATGRVWVCMI